MCDCPASVKKDYMLGRLRYRKLQEKKDTPAQVSAKLNSFVFEAEDPDIIDSCEAKECGWRFRPTVAMSEVERAAAELAWGDADTEEKRVLER